MNWTDDCTGMQVGMMMFGMFVFWGILIILGFYLMRNYVNGNNKLSHAKHVKILKERLVKGEIKEDEYELLKEKIKK